MTTTLELDLLATPQQQEIINCNSRLQYLACGRRWGKTFTAQNKIIKTAFEIPDAEILYIAPTYRRSLKEYERTKNAIPAQYIRKKREQPPPYLILFNGARISYLSFDNPDSILGDPADLVVGDEAARLNGEEFWRVAGPMVADRGGTIFLCSTFRGCANWFYLEWKKAKDGKTPGASAWLYPTHTGIAFQGEAGKKRLEDLRAQYPKFIWDEEFECVPTANSNQVFQFIEGVITQERGPFAPQTGHAYLAGIDIGDVADNTAIVVMERQTGRVVFAYKFERDTGYEKITEQCAEFVKQWNAYPILDATGGGSGGHADSYVRFFKRVMPDVKPFIWSANSKEQSKENIIGQVALDVEKKLVSIPDCFSELVLQMRKYEFTRLPTGVRFGAPKGDHDDYVSAFCMAAWARFKGWGHVSNGYKGLL